MKVMNTGHPEAFADGTANKRGMKQISMLGCMGNIETGAVLDQVGEGAAACTDILILKNSQCRGCFFWMLFPRMGECSSDACIMVAVSEPILKPVQLK